MQRFASNSASRNDNPRLHFYAADVLNGEKLPYDGTNDVEGLS